jgi:AraC family transcriptional regulator, regulatory protein of adaptative response / methylphosphotriester-DNA alkyltransferase methyltransferase
MNRKQALTNNFMTALREHFEAIERGEVKEMYTANEFAAALYVHPGHLGDTVKETTGRSICEWLNVKTLEYIEDKLLHTDLPIKVIADHLTFETPSNFTKYFKKHRGMTPKVFRKTEKPRTSPFSGAEAAVSLLKKNGK